MQRPDFKEGIRLAAFQFALMSILAAGSYILGCLAIGRHPCSFEEGWSWILRHPVFPHMIPAATLFGFLIGAFGHIFVLAIPQPIRTWLFPYKGIVAWIFVILLIAAFVLWGLPDVRYFMSQ